MKSKFDQMLNLYKKNYDFILITTLFCSILTFYIINQPIEFQCDSALFYNYGSYFAKIANNFYLLFFIILLSIFFYLSKNTIRKYFVGNKTIVLFSVIILFFIMILYFNTSLKNPFQIADLKRPPIYPIFLFFSGLYTFNSFNSLILTQSILSFIVVIEVYLISKLFYRNKYIPLIIVICYMMTGMPFMLIKFLIAEQLFLFFSINAIFFMIYHYKKNKIVFLNLALIISTLAWLTKWEGVLIFFSIILYLILNIKRLTIKNIIFTCLIPFIILMLWISSRAIVTNDYENFWSISKSNNEQLFYKFYSVIPSQLYNYKIENKLSLKENNLQKNLIFNDRNDIVIIDKNNGINSSELYSIILNYLSSNPESYKPYKKYLKDAYNVNGIDIYYEIFGKFDSKPEQLTENIFNQPNIYYFNFLNIDLDKFIGKEYKNILYEKSIKESIYKDPSILLIFLSDFLLAQGIDLKKLLNKKLNISSGVKNISFINPFNAGECAKNNLSEKNFKQYEKSHLKRDSNKIIKLFVDFNDSIKDNFRTYLSALILLFSITLIISKDFKLYLPIIIIPFAYDLVIALTVAENVDTKYEIISLSIKFIIFIMIINRFIVFFRNNKIQNE